MSNQPVLFPDRQLIDEVRDLKAKVAYYESALQYIIDEADALNLAADIAQCALDGTYMIEP